jgi:acetylornithine deacetylase/succinyl-diaminopimelate desuccinylase-like protein
MSTDLFDSGFICNEWDMSAIPTLLEYTRIPNQSPMFDPDWETHGYMDQAIVLFSDWCRRQQVRGLTLDVVRAPGRTPLMFLEIPGTGPHTVLLYGHLDKQPETTGWRPGLGPWQPVIEGDRFYGRGVADDGYALFSCLIAVRALQQRNQPHGRCVVIIEACEESGSQDLPFYMKLLSDRIGTPDLAICLDASCGNYDQLWCTSSLRGFLNGTLRVEILKSGVHSGDASGIVPSSFRILRSLLARIEDADTGRLLPEFLHAPLPARVPDEARQVAQALGDLVHTRFPFIAGARAAHPDNAELVLNGTWRPTLSITGADGLPPLDAAGNVLRPGTALKLSFRLPPGVDAEHAAARLKELLETNPPYGARVTFSDVAGAQGWQAPALRPALRTAINDASLRHFGRPAAWMGDGGSIPFMDMLGRNYPHAQFFITGILGPGSNAHGPNEFMHIPTVKKLTCCVAEVIARHHTST